MAQEWTTFEKGMSAQVVQLENKNYLGQVGDDFDFGTFEAEMDTIVDNWKKVDGYKDPYITLATYAHTGLVGKVKESKVPTKFNLTPLNALGDGLDNDNAIRVYSFKGAPNNNLKVPVNSPTVRKMQLWGTSKMNDKLAGLLNKGDGSPEWAQYLIPMTAKYYSTKTIALWSKETGTEPHLLTACINASLTPGGHHLKVSDASIAIAMLYAQYTATQSAANKKVVEEIMKKTARQYSAGGSEVTQKGLIAAGKYMDQGMQMSWEQVEAFLKQGRKLRGHTVDGNPFKDGQFEAFGMMGVPAFFDNIKATREEGAKKKPDMEKPGTSKV